MKKNKFSVPLLILGAIAAALLLLSFNSGTNTPAAMPPNIMQAGRPAAVIGALPAASSAASTTGAQVTVSFSPSPTGASTGTQSGQTTKSPAAAPAVNTINVKLAAAGASYSASVPENSSVYDLMRTLASSTNFSFKGDYYSGLGYFITEINGKPNAGGAYWTLYVNGKYSDTGASQTKLSPGDEVEWKYEK